MYKIYCYKLDVIFKKRVKLKILIYEMKSKYKSISFKYKFYFMLIYFCYLKTNYKFL